MLLRVKTKDCPIWRAAQGQLFSQVSYVGQKKSRSAVIIQGSPINHVLYFHDVKISVSAHASCVVFKINHMDEFSVLHKSARLPDGAKRVRAAVGKVNEYPILIRIHRLYTLHNYGFRTGGAASGRRHGFICLRGGCRRV